MTTDELIQALRQADPTGQMLVVRLDDFGYTDKITVTRQALLFDDNLDLYREPYFDDDQSAAIDAVVL